VKLVGTNLSTTFGNVSSELTAANG
jgi:hypothetical protein